MKCLVKGCGNHRDAGTFVGDLCMPCHTMITTGNVHPKNPTFIGNLYRLAGRLQQVIGEMTVVELIERTTRPANEDTDFFAALNRARRIPPAEPDHD